MLEGNSALQAKNPYKSLSNWETLKALNFCLICLIPLKFSTFTNLNMLFQVMMFLFVFGENLKRHVTGDTSSLAHFYSIYCNANSIY